jgi:hypothetical protein
VKNGGAPALTNSSVKGKNGDFALMSYRNTNDPHRIDSPRLHGGSMEALDAMPLAPAASETIPLPVE